LNQHRDWWELRNLLFVKMDCRILLFHAQFKFFVGSALVNANHLYQSHLNQSRDWFKLKDVHFVKVDCKLLLFRRRLQPLEMNAFSIVRGLNRWHSMRGRDCVESV
jgi:hypothetical protein